MQAIARSDRGSSPWLPASQAAPALDPVPPDRCRVLEVGCGDGAKAVGDIDQADGWLGYEPLKSKGYDHEITFLKGMTKTPSELMPRVHRVISLLKNIQIILENIDIIFVSFFSSSQCTGACAPSGN